MSSRLHFKSVHYEGQTGGPRVIILGAVHGNETCGTKAILRVMAQLDSGALCLAAGSLTLVPVANPLAYALGKRDGERNLNRSLFPKDHPLNFEDRIANWLCPLLAQHEVLLDLHSFAASSEAFVMVGPRDNRGPLEPFAREAQERAWARRLGVRRFVDGWLPTHAEGVQRRTPSGGDSAAMIDYGMGTTEYLRSRGGYALTLECGQHDAPGAPELAYGAIVNTLAFLGMIAAAAAAPVAAADMEAISMVAVHDKMGAHDVFSRNWVSFERVQKGDEIGKRADGSPVRAEFDGRILFPDPMAAPGHEWYYLAKTNPSF